MKRNGADLDRSGGGEESRGQGNCSQDVRERNQLSIKENFILLKKNDKVIINTGQGCLL